jgi:iron complex transport system permease protein
VVARGLELGLALVTGALVVLALHVGPGGLALTDVLDVLGSHLLGRAPDHAPTVDALVWDLRLPRALVAALVGAALGAAGAVTQGLLRNPMAEPGVLGVSAGAAALAVLGFSLGLDAAGLWATPALAALGGALTFAVLLHLTRSSPRMSTLLLSGIAISAMCGAATTLLLSLDTERWDLGIKVVRWLMGSFEGRSWDHLGAAIVPVLAGLLVAIWLRLDLDALTLGADTAASLGVDLSRTRLLALLSVALLVGTATALCGVIGFVGLVVPHIVRLIAGAGHRRLVPASALGGAAALLVVDVASRAATEIVIPPGVVTALLGGPLFLWLLLHHDREWGA